MLRPRHLASFACAAALAAATLAQAEPSRGPQLRSQPHPTAALGPSATKLFEAGALAGFASQPAKAAVNWPDTIDARLARLPARLHAPGRTQQGHAALALRAQLERTLSFDAQPGALAIHVRDLDTGAVLFDHRGDQHLNPASNQKILTAHAAAELLGPDYRFETRVLRKGDTLYLVGQGDPSLKLAQVHELAATLTQQARQGAAQPFAGIEHLVLDDSAFSSRRYAPGLEEHHGEAAYLAPTSALSLNFNTVEIHVRPGAQTGAPAQVTIFPPTAQVELRNRATTGTGAVDIDSFEQGGRTVVAVRGALPLGAAAKHVRRRIHDPSRFTGHAFLAALEGQGVQTAGWDMQVGSTPPEASLLARHVSAPLTHVLASAMKFSNNFTTEQVLRTLAWRASGQPGDWALGHAVLERFSAAVVHEPDALSFENGSGLSRLGRATPSALVDLIALADDQGYASNDLLASYAGYGREGTLAHRLTGAKGLVRAKTGTLAGVSALSGIASSQDGSRRLGFSILVNGRHASQSRGTQDQLVAAMLSWLDRP